MKATLPVKTRKPKKTKNKRKNEKKGVLWQLKDPEATISFFFEP